MGAKESGMTDEALRDRAKREKSYRERALKLFPWVCGICCREFAGKKLKELTVHHKDHNHNNNPPDGSNWELLCIYCHDHEHEKGLGGRSAIAGSDSEDTGPSIASPFDALDGLLPDGNNAPKTEPQ